MPNLSIKKYEMFFLRKEILKKYADFVGNNLAAFEKELTGYIGMYEKISSVFLAYISDEKNLDRYSEFIKESPLKIRLKRLDERIEDKKKFTRDLRSFVSDNVLRKLIFYGPQNNQLTFKEDFITACYFYIHADRLLFLQKNAEVIEEDKTISPIPPAEYKIHKKTVPVFGKESKFSLQPLQDNNDIDHLRNCLEFKGEKSEVNRANLDPNNMTITSKVQAEIRFDNGEWYLENKSALHTTFIVVNKTRKLSKGDIIVFGNKRFLFDEM